MKEQTIESVREELEKALEEEDDGTYLYTSREFINQTRDYFELGVSLTQKEFLDDVLKIINRQYKRRSNGKTHIIVDNLDKLKEELKQLANRKGNEEFINLGTEEEPKIIFKENNNVCKKCNLTLDKHHNYYSILLNREVSLCKPKHFFEIEEFEPKEVKA